MLTSKRDGNTLSLHSTLSQIQTEQTPLLSNVQDIQQDIDQEFKWLLRNSPPVIGTYLLQASLQLASIFTLGHRGPTELAASALAGMFANVTAWSVTLGTATALDTLCSQAWTGARDKSLVGVYLQRALLILGLMFIPIGVVWWNATKILEALGQESELAYHAGLFLRIQILGAPAFIVFEALKKYLQAQGIMKISTYVVMLMSPVNFGLNYALVFCKPFQLGFIGAPIATALCYWLMLILLLGYVMYTKRGAEAWGGWSTDAFNDWWGFLRLAIPGVLMLCSEWWAFELAALATSYLGTVDLAAQSILLTSAGAAYTIPYGISVAATNRVGNSLGEGFAQKAQHASIMALAFGIVLGIANSAFFMATRSYFGYLFTTDIDIVARVASILPIFALFQTADALCAVCGGIIRGLGRQKTAAWINLLAYYVVALPMGYFLTFDARWGLKGIWASLCVTLFLAAAGECMFVFIVDWSSEVKRSIGRVKKEENHIHNCH